MAETLETILQKAKDIKNELKIAIESYEESINQLDKCINILTDYIQEENNLDYVKIMKNEKSQLVNFKSELKEQYDMLTPNLKIYNTFIKILQKFIQFDKGDIF